MSLSRGFWVGAFLAAGMLSGCGTQDAQGKRFQLVRGRPFEHDLPVPAGFVMVEQASEDRSTGSTRLYLRHMYQGKADKYAVRHFYRDQMPLARWTKVSDGNVKGLFTMRYKKGDESCTVTISDQRKVFGSLITVQIVIAREEHNQAPPTTRTGT